MSQEGVYVCADLGVNWLGDFQRLLSMMRECKAAGADAVKLQFFDKEYLDNNKAEYLASGIYTRLSKMCLAPVHVQSFHEFCKDEGIELVVTPFSFKLAMQLSLMKCYDGIKIRAADWFNKNMWDAVCKLETKRYISFPHEKGQIPAQGATPEDVLWALSRRGPSDFKVYCVPKYPPKLEELYLTNVAQYDGFSSHYPDYRIPLMAATLAVNWQKRHGKRRFYLEVHLKPSRINNQLLPDAKVSLDKYGLADLCKGIKMLEEAIG